MIKILCPKVYSDVVIIALLFMISIPVYSNTIKVLTLDDIRFSYYRAVLNPAVAPYLLVELEALDSGSPTIQAYIGATQALLAVLTHNPFAQIKHLRKSVSTLESAVDQESNNAEIRFLRFAVQSNIPRFLGLSREMRQDKAIILQNLMELKGFHPDVKSFIKMWLKESGVYSQEEVKIIEASIK